MRRPVRHYKMQQIKGTQAGSASLYSEYALFWIGCVGAEIKLEPTRGVINHCLEGTRFRKQMAGTRDNFQCLRPAQPGEGLLVELNDDVINAADDQKRRRVYLIEDITGKVRASAARDNRSDLITEPRRRDECCCRSRTRPEET